MTVSSKTKQQLLPTLNELLYGIEAGAVSSIDKHKLDETALRYICEHVLDINLSLIPKTSLTSKDFRAVFLQDWADELYKYKPELDALAGNIAENKLTYHYSVDDLHCKLEISNSTQEVTFDKNTDAGKVLSLLIVKNGFVSMEQLVQAVYSEKRKVTATTRKKVEEAVRNIRKKFRVYKTPDARIIEPGVNRYRLTIPVSLTK